MKRITASFLLILCLLSLCSCSEVKSNKQDEFPLEINQTDEHNLTAPMSRGAEKNAEQNQVSIGDMNNFREVLLGNSSFYKVGSDENISIKELYRCFTSDDTVKLKASSFTVIDLDEDGMDEIVLWLEIHENEPFGCVILHSVEDKVYGYPLWHRAFNSLKTDGIFHFSSGAGSNGFGKITFTPQEYAVKEITFCQTHYTEKNEAVISFFVNSLPADRADFETETEKQNSKQDAEKYSYTEDNIKNYIS